MRDNLLYYNLPETKDENATKIVLKLIEEKLHIKDATNKIKIDRFYRLGKPKAGESKPRPKVAKFNYFQDMEQILQNAKKLKGTNVGIGEKFPAEIVTIRRELIYPELKKAREAGKKPNFVRDKLIIEGQIFYKQR